MLHNQHRYPTWLQFAQQNNINIVKVMIRWLKDNEIIAIQTPYLAFTGEAYAATSYDYWKQNIVKNWFPVSWNGFYRARMGGASHTEHNNVKGFIGTLEMVKILWQRMESAEIKKSTQPENLEHWHSVHHCLRCTISAQIIYLHDQHYTRFTEAEKA
ncbi:hypothetical protein [Kingella negevensis]|uniref:hypothetical protein n=1 Tax=Kingella negevensis TaxID=1522312 RepID=UPI0005C4E12D|nr:hypothetical protein [Kingella negevensis]MDK4688466.1 hypothetical protein [Kingella negevensis]WII90279.1 hypothetical protein QEO93_07310 [Kingella negevensis]